MGNDKNVDIMHVDFREYLQLETDVPGSYNIRSHDSTTHFYDSKTGKKRELPPLPSDTGLYIFNEETGYWEEDDITISEFFDEYDDDDDDDEYDDGDDDEYDDDDDDDDDDFDDDEYDEYDSLDVESPFAPIQLGEYIIHLYASEYSFCTPRMNSVDKYAYTQWELMIEKKHATWDFVVCSSEIMRNLGYESFLTDDIYIAYVDTAIIQTIFNHLLEKLDITTILK